MKLSKSTLSEWLFHISLSEQAQKRLKEKQILGQYKSAILKRQRTEENRKLAKKKALAALNRLNPLREQYQLFCALLWWCEGNKDTSQIKLTNSDPSLIHNFLYTLRKGFDINESKLRILVHLHDYHDEEEQKKFWSKITQIPLCQFHKSYYKPHTGIRKHNNYQGCIAISYYDAKIAKKLEAIYNAFTLIQGGVR